MAQLSRPRLLPSRVSALPFGICLLALVGAGPVRALAASALASAEASALVAASDLATEFVSLPDATAAEIWLAQNIPAGTALSDHPRFFAAAHEVFFDAEDNLLVFVYRSADPDRWVAWVSFDAERVGVIDTSATGL